MEGNNIYWRCYCSKGFAAESIGIKDFEGIHGPEVVTTGQVEGLVIDVLEPGLYDLAALPVA
ncbi:hypothetical protein ACQKNS_06225 [Peribacillus sp. NPDC094092]|uniref:hypothetical protein n=1 Tax=Peribacillus sp. NPDC094092 TaxID=3390611 RepID=UPI003CFFC2BE